MSDLGTDTSYSLYTESSDEPLKKIPAKWALVFTATTAILISILGFLSNLLTIVALPHVKKLRNAATWFIVNLAVIEMCFCVTVLPMSAAQMLHLQATNDRLFDAGGCKLFVFLRYVIIQAELLSIAGIALNRCILIAIPKKYPTIFSSAKTFGYIVGIWIVSIVAMIFPLVEIYGAFNYNSNTQECDFDTKALQARKVYLAIGFFVPCLIIIISYSYIFYKSRESSRRLEKSKAKNGCNDNLRPAAGLRNREMRIARTIAVIFLVFIICCSPVSFAHYYLSQGQMPMLLLLLHPLYWLQYCLNGFIYVFMNKQYREAYISYISQFWPTFKTMTERCYQPTDDDTSMSQPGSKSPGNPLRKISLSLKGTPELPRICGARHATPVAKKKFQCWDPNQRQRKISTTSSERKISNISNERKFSNISSERKSSIFSSDSVFTSSKGSFKSAFSSPKSSFKSAYSSRKN